MRKQRQVWNKAKVVCTIGPACATPRLWEQMMRDGMDVARFNFSHGSIDEKVAEIKRFRAAAQRCGGAVAVLQDLPGPKMRIGDLKAAFIDLKKGQEFFLTGQKIRGDEHGVYLNNPRVLESLEKGHRVYLNDGLVRMEVSARRNGRVICKVSAGGRVYPRKGVSCPDRLSVVSAVTAYDLRCVDAGLDAGVDCIAVSFVECAADVEKIKRYAARRGKRVFVIAKIERPAAMAALDEIVAASDGIMVARGDLGIEMDLHELPFLQKRIIRACNAAGKPVITATQMLMSMVENAQPTRAEVTDIANAILDGTDALMLSEETAVGAYPRAALRTMITVARRTEENLNVAPVRQPAPALHPLSEAAVAVAGQTRAKIILAPVNAVSALGAVSRLRPCCPIIAVTTEPEVYRQTALFWGVYPLRLPSRLPLPEFLAACEQAAVEHRWVKPGDRMVVVLTDDNAIFAENIVHVREVGSGSRR
ncbi:MAG: pyruvate kinase [Candidatus Omnitrophica bacterium]|nr:pyruvate kinase [Candidatus Omnitrophota bacterium]